MCVLRSIHVCAMTPSIHHVKLMTLHTICLWGGYS
jgi:hypothetical protein